VHTPMLHGHRADSDLTMAFDFRRLAVAFAGTAAFLDLYAPQSLLPELAREFRVGEAVISLTITASMIAVALTAPFAGSLADVVGRKRIIVAAAFGLCLPTAMLAFVGSIEGMFFWRFVQGLFIPPIYAVTVAYIGEEWPPAEIGPVTALYIGGSVLGGFGGRFIIGNAAELWGWQQSFLALAAVNLACATGIALFLPKERTFKKIGGLAQSLGKMAGHFRNRRLVATFAIGFAILFSIVATFTYVNFYLAAPPFGLTPAALGTVFTVYLVGVVVTPLSGSWVRRFGNLHTLVGGTACSIAGLLLTLSPSLLTVIPGLALAATGLFIVQATATSFLPIAATEAKASAIGLYGTCYYVGGSVGAFAPSVIWKNAGWTGCVSLVIGVEILIALLAIRFWFVPARLSDRQA